MAKLCCIPVCPNSKSDDQGVACFPFPAADAELRTRWIDFVGGNPDKFRWKFKYICAKHFLQLELFEADGQQQLLDGAVPLVYCPGADGDEMDRTGDVMTSEELSTATVKGKPAATVTSEFTTTANKDDFQLRSLFCRICLKKKDTGLVPFKSKLNNTNLIDIIYTITGLKRIDMYDELPDKVCGACVEKIELAFNIRKEILRQNRVLRNLWRNKRLQDHYKSYDKRRFDGESATEAHLNRLLSNVKQEMIIEESMVDYQDALEIGARNEFDDHDEPIMSTMNQDEFESTEAPPAVSQKTAPSEEDDNSDSQLDVAVKSDSEKSEDSGPKFVFSWKEFVKPKSDNKSIPKIADPNLPKPNLVPNTCYVCDTAHDNGDAMEIHMAQHVSILPYKCEQCSTEQVPQVFNTLATLNKHLQTHLYPYQCDYCPLRFLQKYPYVQHMKWTHEITKEKNDGFTCDYCGRHFEQSIQLRRHINRHKAMEEEKYKCEHCGKAFCNSFLLKRHVRLHTGEMPFECKQCGKFFNHEFNFINHKRTHIGEKAYVCKECDKNFINGAQLRYHMKVHYPDDPRYRVQKPTRTEPLSCAVENCDFVTDDYHAHYNHQAKHLKRFYCKICDKNYATKKAFVNHTRTIHEGKELERKFPCTYCQKMFPTKQNLRKHVDRHENNRRYKCQFCDKAFVQKQSCTEHERVHTGERPYVCRGCPSAFTTASGRKKHERTHRGLEISQDQLKKPENDSKENGGSDQNTCEENIDDLKLDVELLQYHDILG